MLRKMSPAIEVLFSTLLAACSGSPPPAEGAAARAAEPSPDGAPARDDACPDPPRRGAPGGARRSGLDGPAFVAARTAEGGVALVDIGSGAALASAAGGDLGGESDLVCDPWLSRVLAFEADADGEWGEIASYPIEQGAGDGEPPVKALGPRDHEVWVDGLARVAASPYGALVFEDGVAGPRWKLVSAQGLTPSAWGPRPAALETGLDAAGDFRIFALTYGPSGDALDIRTATVDPGDGIQPELTTPLSLLPPERLPSVRWAVASAGPYLLSAQGGDVVVSVPVAGATSPWTAVPVGSFIERVEHAVALQDGPTLAALTSGEADVVLVRLDAAGSPACAAALDLPGEALKSTLFFSRGLAVAGPDRVLAATSSGVFAIDVSDACPLAVNADPTFAGDALRGPLDACAIDD
jgi:hypothetical protein